MKKLTVAEINVGDNLSFKDWKPRLIRVVMVALGAMISHSAHLDSEGWWYLTVPSVALGLAIEIFGSLLSGGAKKPS